MAKGKILVVDDEIYIVHILDFSLGMEGYEVLTALDGEQALEKARAEHPDLIVLDIMMPKLDGKEVLRRIRELEKERGRTGLAGTKILMTTALNDFETIMASFRGQCEGYLVKPISKAKLFAQLRALGLLPADE